MTKIIDAFMFFNEVELLDLRLHELYDAVDRFVLVETSWTHQGNPKPFYWAEQFQYDDRFADVRDKVFYLTIRDQPSGDGSWDRENFHRNCIQGSLYNFADDDIVMISDCDEIPHPGWVKEVAKNGQFPITFEQDYYCYFLNLRTPHKWKGTVMTTVKEVMDKTPQYFRDNKDTFPIQEHGGWHMGYMGGLERVRTKLTSFAHTEYSQGMWMDKGFLNNRINQGIDLYQPRVKFYLVDLTSLSLPKFLRENPDRFKEMTREQYAGI